MNILDLQNKNGDTLCMKVGCRKSKFLKGGFGGFWCCKHYEVIAKIRGYVNHTHSFDEFVARWLEMQHRKRFDIPHTRKCIEQAYVFGYGCYVETFICNNLNRLENPNAWSSLNIPLVFSNPNTPTIFDNPTYYNPFVPTK